MAFSKSKVNRAGQTLADRLHSAAQGEPMTEFFTPELFEAVDIVDWWRSSMRNHFPAWQQTFVITPGRKASQ